MSIEQPLHIGFVSRSTLYSSPGGDTVQIDKTAKYLQRLGHQVSVFTSTDHINYDQFDLFHFFNITRPADILSHVSKTSKPFFISPIFLDLQEYEKKNRKRIHRLFTSMLSSSRIEYLKCIARFVRNGEKVNSWEYLRLGHHNSMKKLLQQCTAILPNSHSEFNRIKLLQQCTAILPNSHSEFNRIQQYFSYDGASAVVPCGVDLEVFDFPSIPKDEKLVLCIGRIEGRKNQLALIKALATTDFHLVIIGNPSPNHIGYYEECKRAANDKVTFIENIEQQELIQFYQKAKVHVLASWFETVGLSSLEAAFCNCNIVVCDKGDVTDYFKDNVWYCCPDDEKSILHAVQAAAAAPTSDDMQQFIRNHYTWEIAAQKTLEAYHSFL